MKTPTLGEHWEEFSADEREMLAEDIRCSIGVLSLVSLKTVRTRLGIRDLSRYPHRCNPACQDCDLLCKVAELCRRRGVQGVQDE